MKASIVTAVVLMLSSFAQAQKPAPTAPVKKTVCAIAIGTDEVYGNLVYQGGLTSPKLVLLNNGSAREIALNEFDTFKKWKEVDGANILSFSRQADGVIGITVGRVDVSKSENMLPLHAMAFGSLEKANFVGLTLPAQGLSASCSNL